MFSLRSMAMLIDFGALQKTQLKTVSEEASLSISRSRHRRARSSG